MQTRKLGDKVFMCSDDIDLDDLFTYEEDFEIFSELLSLTTQGIPLEQAQAIVIGNGNGKEKEYTGKF